jgi:hypothetical protein
MKVDTKKISIACVQNIQTASSRKLDVDKHGDHFLFFIHVSTVSTFKNLDGGVIVLPLQVSHLKRGSWRGKMGTGIWIYLDWEMGYWDEDQWQTILDSCRQVNFLWQDFMWKVLLAHWQCTGNFAKASICRVQINGSHFAICEASVHFCEAKLLGKRENAKWEFWKYIA